MPAADSSVSGAKISHERRFERDHDFPLSLLFACKLEADRGHTEVLKRCTQGDFAADH